MSPCSEQEHPSRRKSSMEGEEQGLYKEEEEPYIL